MTKIGTLDQEVNHEHPGCQPQQRPPDQTSSAVNREKSLEADVKRIEHEFEDEEAARKERQRLEKLRDVARFD
jgi:hypothetical protein